MGDLELLDISENKTLLNELIEHWLDDIETYSPDFEPFGLSFVTALLVKVNNDPAGLFLYQTKDKEVHVELDYISQAHRDKGIGSKIFEQIKSSFIKSGRSKIIALQYNAAHGNYLESIGFSPSSKFKNRYEMLLK